VSTLARPSLARDDRGAVFVEFALLAPVLIIMMIGVFHVAVYVQNYNAIRSIASDAGRHVMVEYQKGNDLDDLEIRAIVLSLATTSPYLLDSDRLEIDVTRATTSRVTGATEFDVDIEYDMADFLPIVELPALQLTYSRPIFVVEPGV
jgi:Flp pilus assembly protein TadG